MEIDSHCRNLMRRAAIRLSSGLPCHTGVNDRSVWWRPATNETTSHKGNKDTNSIPQTPSVVGASPINWLPFLEHIIDFPAPVIKNF